VSIAGCREQPIPECYAEFTRLQAIQTIGAELNVSVRGGHQLEANKLLVFGRWAMIYVDAQVLVSWKAIPVTL
jgi:hypothetical protein